MGVSTSAKSSLTLAKAEPDEVIAHEHLARQWAGFSSQQAIRSVGPTKLLPVHHTPHENERMKRTKLLRRQGPVGSMTIATSVKDLRVARLSGSLGAEIRGISLEQATEADADAIQSLLMEHLVLFFPDQQYKTLILLCS